METGSWVNVIKIAADGVFDCVHTERGGIAHKVSRKTQVNASLRFIASASRLCRTTMASVSGEKLRKV